MKRRRDSKDNKPDTHTSVLSNLMKERDSIEQAQGPKTRQKKRRLEEIEIELDKRNTGMVLRHDASTLSFARANDVVMMWRPINSATASKLEGRYTEEGDLVEKHRGKGLNTKGKSSEFGPIYGDIPYDARLSKLALQKKEEIPSFQKQNEQAIEKSKIELTELRDRIDTIKDAGRITELEDVIIKANDAYLLTRIDKKSPQDKLIYFVLNKQGEPLFQKVGNEQKPTFVIQSTDNSLFQYEYDTNEYKHPFILEEGHDIKLIEIMAYVQFSFDKENNEVQENYFPVTADYDEFASSPRKIYPFLNNKEGIRTRVSLELYKHLANHTKRKSVDPLEIAASVVLEYELQQKREHRDKAPQGSMGVVNAVQWATKTFMKGEVDGATNHGPETNNPFPEELSDGRYPVHLPSGEVRILHNEHELISFINNQRKAGFPIDVHPKWGWEIDEETRELYIPRHKFSWTEVNEAISKYYCDAETLAAEVGSDKRAVDELFSQHADEAMLMNLKAQIEGLRLESDIIYSEQFNNYGDMPEENEREKKFRLEVAKLVKKREIEIRNEEVERLSEKLHRAEEEYYDKNDKISAVERAERNLLEITGSLSSGVKMQRS